MNKLLIKYRFESLPYIVADGKGNFYQLPHTVNKYFKSFRKLKMVLNNKITEGYRINRQFISLKQLRKKAYVAHEVIDISNPIEDMPF